MDGQLTDIRNLSFEVRPYGELGINAMDGIRTFKSIRGRPRIGGSSDCAITAIAQSEESRYKARLLQLLRAVRRCHDTRQLLPRHLIPSSLSDPSEEVGILSYVFYAISWLCLF